jgi:hypothetical protein
MALFTLIVYGGLGLGLAVLLHRRIPRSGLEIPTFVVRLLLWPVFLPLLLPQPEPPAKKMDADEARIRAAETALAEALRSLGTPLGEGLSLEMRRVESLGRALRGALARKNELDGLLNSPGYQEHALEAELERTKRNADGAAVSEIMAQRLAHVRKLQALRTQTQAELERALARAGELATRLTLLRYDHPPEQSAAATAQQLTHSIDELCSLLTEVRST